MSGIITALQGELDEAIYIIWVTRICQVAATALVLYDHVITLDQEVKHIWKRFSLATVLYAIIRYAGGAFVISSTIALMVPPQSEEFCKTIANVQTWFSLPVLFCTQAVLQIRLYVLYRRSQKVLSFMLVSYAAEVVTLIVLMVEMIKAIEVIEMPFFGVAMCTGAHATALPSDVVFTIICFEGLLFIVLLWLGIRHIGSAAGRTVFGRSLLETLIKGNMFYFACILTACLVDVIIWKTLGGDWLVMPVIFSNAVPVIAGCRLILSLHGSIFRDTLSETLLHA